MGDIGSLLCGNETAASGSAKIALDQLSTSIRNFSRRAIQFMNEEGSEDALIFGPFCARVLLENACAALVGRLDTFRMLYLSEFQAQPNYEHGKRSKSAFSWQGDVIPTEEKPHLWNVDNELSKISRALFSKHSDHVYWKPAVERMLDFVSSTNENNSHEFITYILSFDATTYMDESKGRGLQLYSTLSKSVHWEFFTGSVLFDETTVKDTIRDTCLLVSHLGLTSHFIPTAYASLSPEEAVAAYLAFRREVP